MAPRPPRPTPLQLLLALTLLLYAALKSYGLRPAAGDENIYFYMAARTAEGVLPYRDFFFAHPPLHLLPGVLLCLLAGFSLPLLKAVPMVATGTGGLLLARLPSAPGEPLRLQGVLAAALLLLSHDALRASSHWTGANLATAAVVGGWLATERGRDRLAGLLYAAAACTALYAAPVAAALALGRLLQDRRAGLQTVLAGLAGFGLVQVGGLLLAPGGYLEQVYAYHLRKPPTEGALLGSLTSIALRNPWLLASPLLGLGLLGRRVLAARAAGAEPPWTLLRAALALLAAAAMLASLGRLYHFYFLVAFPPAALLGAEALAAALREVARLLPALRARLGLPGPARPAVALLLALLLLGGAEATRAWGLSHKRWYQRSRGQERAYQWRPSPVLPEPLDAAVRALFWKDRRRIGGRHLGITQYLWHESRLFESAEAMAEAVRRHRAEGPLFGDSTSTPLVALRAGRRLSLDEADTNFMRFRAGLPPIGVFLRRIEQRDPPALVLLRPGRGVATAPQVRRWVRERFRLLRRFRDPYQGTYLLYARR